MGRGARGTSPSRVALRNFSSQWFLVPQGTGIIALILHQLDYQFNGLGIIADIFWILTILLLLLTVTVYLIRAALFPRYVASEISSNIAETCCLASVSITFTSIIQMLAVTVVREWGSGWGIVCYVLWWINTGMTLLACIGIPYIFTKYDPPGMDAVTPSTQLPLIAALTSAAGGGVICRYAALDARLQVPVIIVSYLLVGLGLPLAVGLDTVFLTRLLNRSSPSKTSVYQEMILCGPWGQGSFALQMLGQCVMRGSFAQYGKGIFLTANAAQPVGYISLFAGLLAWGQGTFWWAFAIISIVHAAFEKPGRLRAMKFGLPTWSLVFPWGVYTNAAVQLGQIMDSPAFMVWSTALAMMLVIIWLVNVLFTVIHVANGSILGLKEGWTIQRVETVEDGEKEATVDRSNVDNRRER